MTVRNGKLLAGLNSLAQGSSKYTYNYSQNTSYNCSITQPFSQLINHLYPHISEPLVAQDFSNYISLPSQLLGKRSSDVLISKSRRLCLKLIDENTFTKMTEIFKDMLHFKQQHEDSFLIEIYRVYQVETILQKYHTTDVFILMPSLRSDFDEMESVYDIKGYVDSGRSLSPEDVKNFKFGKDENFICSKELQLLQAIPRPKREQIVQSIERSTKFLENNNIIDYSLLVSFRKISKEAADSNLNIFPLNEEMAMELQLIDYFQEFNLKKKVENKVKLLFKKQVSSIEPALYSQRFVEFLRKYFLRP